MCDTTEPVTELDPEFSYLSPTQGMWLQACALGVCERASARVYVRVTGCNPESFSKVFLPALHLVPNWVYFLFPAIGSLQFQLLKTIKCLRKKTPANSNSIIFSVKSKLRPIRPAALDEWATRCQVPGGCPGHRSPQEGLRVSLHFL